MEFLTTCKVYLQEFDYPNVNSLDELQLVDLFRKENRYSLLCWIVKIISSEFVPSNDHTTNAENVMADYLFENGFCTSSQKQKFVIGKGLDVNDEIKIFKRIFNFMHNIKKKNDSQYKDNDAIISNLIAFLNQSVNIFPSYGPQKVLSDKDRQAKLNLYKSSLISLEQDVKNPQVTEESKNLGQLTDSTDFEIIVKRFENRAHKIAEVNSTVKSHFKKDQNNKSIMGNNESLLQNCRNEINDVLEYMQSQDEILKILEDGTPEVYLNDNLENMEKTVNIHASLCHEISQLKKKTFAS